MPRGNGKNSLDGCSSVQSGVKHCSFHKMLWSGEMKGRGLSLTNRNKTILDLVAAEKLKGLGLQKAQTLTWEQRQSLLKGVFCDVSQNPKFASYTNDHGVTGCLATPTILYSYGKDRIVLPFEYILFQGHRRGMQFPTQMKSSEIKTLAGEGMFLASLGSVIWAMYLLKGLP